MKRKGMQGGFTLMELMVTVAILGILAAIAIPAFSSYLSRSKTSEVSSNLNSLFKGAASYYAGDIANMGIQGSTGGYCTVASTDVSSPELPGKDKQPFTGTPQTRALAFHIADLVYFSYGIDSIGSGCGRSASTLEVYTLYANGDLNEDGTLSTFELAVGSDDDNLLYHGRGMYVANELE